MQMGDAAPRERQPSEPGRGNTESVTNPRVIAGTGKLNPFYETMPAPEQWHRNMPPYFPFGETPYMQREMSRQINEDLARGAAGNEVASAPTSGVLNNMFNKARQLMGGGGSPRRGPPSEGPQFMGAPPFVMPKVIEGDVDRARADFERQERQVQGQIEDMHRRASPGRGRSGRSPRPIKRARRRSSSGSRGPTDHEMSGAL